MEKPTYKFGNQPVGMEGKRTMPFVIAGAVLEREGRILLVRESVRGNPDDGKWNQPAGHLEVGEDPVEAVKREVLEETGMEFTPTGLLGIYSLVRKDVEKERGWTPHALKLIFTGAFRERPGAKLEKDISETKWFTQAEIEGMDRTRLRDMDIKKEVRDYFSGRRYPLESISHLVQSAL